MWKRFLQSVVSFSNVENLFLSFWKYLLIQHRKGESFWGEAFNLQGCKESNSLSKWVASVEEISSKCCKLFKCAELVFQVSWKYQVSRWKGLEERSSSCWRLQLSSLIAFVTAFVFKMSSFQMESLKFMEKFDCGNFHLWKFKMRMMLSKHGHLKFVVFHAKALHLC